MSNKFIKLTLRNDGDCFLCVLKEDICLMAQDKGGTQVILRRDPVLAALSIKEKFIVSETIDEILGMIGDKK